MKKKRFVINVGLPRACKTCGKRFQPTGKAHKVCFDCIDKSNKLKYQKKSEARNK